jgi:hypothetical protein
LAPPGLIAQLSGAEHNTSGAQLLPD